LTEFQRQLLESLVQRGSTSIVALDGTRHGPARRRLCVEAQITNNGLSPRGQQPICQVGLAPKSFSPKAAGRQKPPSVACHVRSSYQCQPGSGRQSGPAAHSCQHPTRTFPMLGNPRQCPFHLFLAETPAGMDQPGHTRPRFPRTTRASCQLPAQPVRGGRRAEREGILPPGILRHGSWGVLPTSLTAGHRIRVFRPPPPPEPQASPNATPRPGHARGFIPLPVKKLRSCSPRPWASPDRADD
jgi:hypothetical protein